MVTVLQEGEAEELGRDWVIWPCSLQWEGIGGF